jgi:diacylglycerol kinase family enzyme
VVVDGVSRGSRDWTAIAVGTVEQIGLGFTPFPDVAAHPSQLQIVEVGGGVPSLALELPNIFRGRHLTRPGNRTGLGRQVILRSEAPMTYMLDGDFYRGTSETTLACDRAVEFVVPP